MSEAVREALEATAGSVEALAEELGVGPHTVWAWRAGRRTPQSDNLRRLADALEDRGGRLLELAERIREEAEREG